MSFSAATAMATAVPPTAKVPAKPSPKRLIVFGLDNNDRPHASWFGEGDMELARKAADLMGMAALEATTDALKALAGQLPPGRVFASGRAFVPFVKGGLYRQLVAYSPVGAAPSAGAGLTPADTAPNADTGPATAPNEAAERVRAAGGTLLAETAASAPSTAVESNSNTTAEIKPDPAQQNGWSAVKTGDLVLAKDEIDAEGWYEARVVEIRGDLFTLTWRDWPELGKIVRRSEHIALLHPAYIAASH